MKKILFILIPFLLLACSGDGDFTGSGDEYGDIVLRPSVSTDAGTVSTRATSLDYTTYKVIIFGPNGIGSRQIDYPANNKITDLVVGSYTITVTSHPGDLPSPAFDNQVYSGQADVVVRDGVETPVQIVCKQANAGVFFEYDDESLRAANLENLVPTVSQNGESLDYKDGNREATGFFSSGKVTLTMKNDGDIVTISGMAEKVLTLQAHQIWKVAVKAGAINNGSAGLDVTVTPVTVIDEEVVVVDIPDNVPDVELVIAGADLQNVTQEQLSATTSLVVTGDILATGWDKIASFEAVKKISLRDFAGKIPAYAFYDSGTAESTFPASLTHFEALKATEVGEYAIAGTVKVKSVNLPEVTIVDKFVFANGAELEEVLLPKTVTIKESAFYLCRELREMNLPALTSAGANIMDHCSELKTFSAPLLTEVSPSMLYYCKGLETVELPKAVTINKTAFCNCTSLRHISLPETVQIGDHAFYFAGTETVELPKAESIGMNCFLSSSLTAISLPNVTTVGQAAFSDCARLASADIPKLSLADSYLFKNCKLLSSINLPQLTEVRMEAFMNCGFTELELPLVAVMDDKAFAANAKLKKISLAKYSGSLSLHVQNCAALEELNMPRLTSVTGMLKGCDALKNISLPGVTSLASQAFAELPNLETIELPKLRDMSGSRNFMGCPKLREVHFPKLTSLEYYTFYGCTALESVSAPLATRIDYCCFKACNALNTLKLGAAESITIVSGGLDGFTHANVDLYLNSSGTEYAGVSGNSWKNYTWKSINAYQP